jgi:mRNA deadenylase 3'-5' endonuclease subunit Ccr4
LADAYIRPAFYPNTPQAALIPLRRRAALLDRLDRLTVDVLCLQEVQADMFAAVSTRLVALQGLFHPKGGRKPDGCATFVKRQLELHSAHPLYYSDGTGHLALLIRISLKGRLLGIANTHARWDPAETPVDAQVGRRQMLELLDEVAGSAPLCQGWILCGDLNAEPKSALVVAAMQRGFVDPYAGSRAYTCNSNRVPKRIDYLLHSPSLFCRPDALPAIDGETPLPSEQEPSDHLALSADFGWT